MSRAEPDVRLLQLQLQLDGLAEMIQDVADHVRRMRAHIWATMAEPRPVPSARPQPAPQTKPAPRTVAPAKKLWGDATSDSDSDSNTPRGRVVTAAPVARPPVAHGRTCTPPAEPARRAPRRPTTLFVVYEGMRASDGSLSGVRVCTMSDICRRTPHGRIEFLEDGSVDLVVSAVRDACRTLGVKRVVLVRASGAVDDGDDGSLQDSLVLRLRRTGIEWIGSIDDVIFARALERIVSPKKVMPGVDAYWEALLAATSVSPAMRVGETMSRLASAAVEERAAV